MKTQRVHLAVLLLTGLLQIAAPNAIAEDRTITMVSDPWPPYVLGELGEDATAGVGVDLIRAVFARLDGYQLRIPLMPWKRALRELEQGTMDGIGIVLKTPERERYLDYSDSVFSSNNEVWYSAARFPGGFDWDEYTDFKDYNVGVIRGHSYGEVLDRMIADRQLIVTELSSARQLFAMLKRERIDFAIADRLVGEALVEGVGDAERRIFPTQKPAAGEVYYMAFSKKSSARHLLGDINRAIAALKQEGVIRKIVGAPGAEAEVQP